MAPKPSGSRKSQKTSKGKRTADTSTSQLQQEEEYAQLGPEVAEGFLMQGNLHPWIQYDRRWVHYARYQQNLYHLMRKEFELPRHVEWEPLERVGLADPIRDLLTNRYEHEGQLYEFREWIRVFDIQEPVFKELCFEFLSTLTVTKSVTSVLDENFMKFRLGGEPRFLSMRQLAECLRIYSPTELSYDFFDSYLASGARIHDERSEFVPGDFWEDFSEKEYDASRVSHKDMNNVHLRVIHRFLAHSIANRRENSEKVTLSDIWYLRQMYVRNRINIPYCVAIYLDTSGGGVTDKGPICGGHFITLIARGLGINFRVQPGLTRVDKLQKSIGYLMYYATRAMAKDRHKNIIPYPEEPAQEAPQQQHQPHPQQPEFQHVQQHHGMPEPTMYDLMQGINRIEVGGNELRNSFYDFRDEMRYRVGNLDYRVDWTAGNIGWIAEQQGYNITHSEPLHQWGTPEASYYPPPVYNHDVARAEAERRRQEEHDREEQLERDFQASASGPWGGWPSAEDREREEEERRQRSRGFWPF